jgi:hypothetical protein
MARKGGCIIYFVDADGTIMVLTGKESNYVSDLTAAPAGAEIPKGWTFAQLISYKQEVSGGGIDETVAKQKFSERALDLEKMLKIGEIRHDTPEEISSGRFRVNYRHLLDDCRKGVFKGGCEGSETPLRAAIRELREELGMDIPGSDLRELPGGNCVNCQMFTCDIGARQRRNFEKVVETRHERRYGELFEVSFKPLSAIMEDIESYNAISACALRRFNTIMNPSSSSKASASSSSSRKSPPRSPGSSSRKSPPGSSRKSPPGSSRKSPPGSSRKSPPRGTKKGGNKSKRNRSHERAYDRRRNKSYKRY